MRPFVGEAAEGVEQLLWSDVWVLYAMVLVAGDGRAELSSVIAAADMINHAIVTWDELNGALVRLRQHRLVSDVDVFVPTELARNLPQSGGHLKRVERLCKALKVKDGSSGAPYRFPRDVEPLVSEADYRRAVDSYLTRT